MQGRTSGSRERSHGLWVLVVMVCGLALGGVLWALHPAISGTVPPSEEGSESSQNLGYVAGVLSVVVLALLAALIVVYLQTYRDTRSVFSLGLVVFLVALTAQASASSPFLIEAFGEGWSGLGAFYLVAMVFEAIALAIFLNLSLD